MDKLFKYSLSGKRRFNIVRWGDMWLIEVSRKTMVGFWLWKREGWTRSESLQYFPTYHSAFNYLQKICE